MSLTVPCDAASAMSVTFPFAHRCPYRDEFDAGAIEITWTTAGATIELHALATYLGDYRELQLSHEDVTAAVQRRLDRLSGVRHVQVATRWKTAGAEVVVRAVPSERLKRAGA